MFKTVLVLLALILAGGILFAQPGQPGGPPPPPPMAGHPPNPPNPPDEGPPLMGHRPPMERALRSGGPGRWWANPAMAQKIGLTSDQKKKMDDIMQQHRLKLIDLTASVQREETIMEPLMGAEQPDEPKILAQIDRVAQARAELEKANARMLFGIRRVLTQDQWKKLQAEAPPDRGPRPPHPPQPPQPVR